MAILLSYLFYFVASSASPLQRRWLATKKNLDNSGQVHFAFQVAFITAVLSLLLPFLKPFELQGDPYKIAFLALVSGLFGAGYYISSYTAQKYIEAGVTILVNNVYTPITILLASLFLQESLTLLQLLGTVILLTGMVIVGKQHRIGKIKFDKHFLLMALSGVMLGVALTAERALQKTTGFTAGTIFSWSAQAGALALAMLFFKGKSQYSGKDVAVTGVLRFFQLLSWVTLTFVVGNLSLVSAVTTFKVVLIFIAGAIFLNERQDLKRKILGSLIACAGLLLMK